MDESIVQAHLAKLAQQAPPPDKQATTRELVARYYDDIASLVITGWEWDAIAEGFQGKNGALKGTTIRKYFYERQRHLDELKQSRKAKRKRPPITPPVTQPTEDPSHKLPTRSEYQAMLQSDINNDAT